MRWTVCCLAVAAWTWAVSAGDGDADLLRADFESRFKALDADGNGLLDVREQSGFPARELEVLRKHGLPAAGPIPRDVYIAAMVSAGDTPAATEAAPEALNSRQEPGKGETFDPARPHDVATSEPETSPAPEGASPVIHLRNSGRRGRYVPELPPEYSARDKDGDGQIALYEWDRKKFAEFAKLDKNRDGFLIPAELLPKETLKSLYTRSAPTATGAGAAVKPVGTAAADEPDAIEREARNTFLQMDDNKDGAIDETDWGRSRRIRPWFESAGIAVRLPINADTFVAYYRRAKDSGGR